MIRFKWCKGKRTCNSSDWSKVIFSNECKLDLHPGKRQYVKRNTGERFKQKYITPSHKFSPRVMIFGAIREDGKSFLSLFSWKVDSNS